MVIPELNNLPGVYSARFYDVKLDDKNNVIEVPKEEFSCDKTETDKKNNKRLIELIKSLPFDKRTAYFEVCFVVAQNGNILFKVKSKSNGFVIEELRGKNGFGYDPLFVGVDTYDKTYAELDSARKNLRSHRKKALRELAFWLINNIK